LIITNINWLFRSIYHAESKAANWVFGGFNAHAAHHIFPKLPHTLYPLLTPIIKKKALFFELPYPELPIPQAILSHFRYLRKLRESVG
jgi:linoleoyl-CoA desaturase